MNTFAPHPSSPTPTPTPAPAPTPTPKSAPTAATPPLLERFLAPGLRLMQRLRLPAKLSILSALMLVPLLGFLAATVLTHNSTLATLERERAGVAVTQGLAELASEVQLNRTQTLQARTDLAAVNAEREHLQHTLAALSQRFEALDAFALSDAWGPVQAASLALSQAPGKDMRALYQQHSQLLKDIQALQDLVAERSELLFDPVASTYFLMVLSTSNLPELSEALGQTFDLASRVLARGEASSRDRWAIAAELERVKHLTQDTEKQIAALARSGHPASPHWSRVRQGAQAFATRTELAFDGDRVPDDLTGYRAAGLELVENTQRLAHESTTVLDQHLARRESDVRQARLLALLTAGLCLVVLSYLVLSFYLSFSRSLSQLQAAAAAMAEGDLSHPVSVHGQDELADMAGTMERTVGMLSVLVADIRTCAVRVDQAGGEIARGGDSLSSRTAQEGLGLGQATSALQQLNSIVARQHRALDQLHDRTRSLGSQSDACSEVTERSVAAMQQLDDSVRRVGEINAVIDDIAFQTNLLALNASVEAARAGELGKGFGIVATEVRALSQRCSDAAAEIRSLIDQTADQSGLSRHSLTEASQLLGELVSGIAAVSNDLQDMAQIGGDQQGSLDTVSRSVSDLNDLTQYNADAVGSTSKASESLGIQARALRKSVSAVQLRQGGADEARTLVERGMRRVLDVGWGTAMTEFNQGDGAWTDRDMYLFAFDPAGCYAVHALRPEHIGKTLDGLGLMSEDKAERFLSDGRSAAAQPSGGWIDYEIYTSAGHAVAKSAYVIQAEEGVFLGCGVHRMHTPAFS